MKLPRDSSSTWTTTSSHEGALPCCTYQVRLDQGTVQPVVGRRNRSDYELGRGPHGQQGPML